MSTRSVNQGPITAARIAIFTLVAFGLSPYAHAREWADIPATDVVLVYPGQVSLQWLLNPATHKGALRFRARERECRDCHAWNLEEVGEKVLHSSVLETTPPTDHRSSADLQARMRVENEMMQVRLEWPVASLPATDQQSAADSTVTLMFDDGQVSSFTRAGCWAACHADGRQMPADDGRGQEKYLIHTRSTMGPTGGGSGIKSAAELNASIASGEFLEIWQAILKSGKPTLVRDGFLLEKRHMNSAPRVSVDARFENDRWVATFSRSLAAPTGFKPLQTGITYTIGFALHDQLSTGRFHLVSYPYTFRITGDQVTLKPLQSDK